MAIITIKRPPGINNKKDYEIYIDGQQAGMISDGEVTDFNTTTGHHLINIKVDEFSSPEIKIETSEDKITILKVVGFKKLKWMWEIIIGIYALHFILKMSIDFRYTTFLIFPVFLFYIYYKTLGWKKYLTLEKI